MSEYTVLKVTDVDDQGPNFGLEGKMEARFMRVDLGCEECGVTYLRLAPGFRIPFGHKHKVQEEVYVLVSGTALIKVDDDIHELGPWSVVRMSKDVMRSLEAGPEGAELVLFGAPHTGPGDAITEPGWWAD
jgi:mannose-6-phosphate isomerase-like protein (cupin superfamily)